MSRERPVRSGNPRGHLKGVRNFAADFKRSLEIPVTLIDKGSRPAGSSGRKSCLSIGRRRPLRGWTGALGDASDGGAMCAPRRAAGPTAHRACSRIICSFSFMFCCLIHFDFGVA